MTNEPLQRHRLRSALTIANAGFFLAFCAAGCGEEEARRPKVSSWSPIPAVFAQEADRVVPPAAIAGAMNPVDEAFAMFIASTGAAEIEGARLVLKTSRNAGVIEFAQKLIRDHTGAGEALGRIASSRGLKLSAAPSGRHADMVTKLAGVAPAERDDAFIQRFGIDAHKEAIAVTERHLREGKDAELKRYAGDILVSLKEHMSAAHKLAYAAAAR